MAVLAAACGGTESTPAPPVATTATDTEATGGPSADDTRDEPATATSTTEASAPTPSGDEPQPDEATAADDVAEPDGSAAGETTAATDAVPATTTTTRSLPVAPQTDVPPPNADGELGPGRPPLSDSTGREAVPSALADRFWPGFVALIDPALIFSGGPPPDGIPAIDAPRFAPTADIDFLADDEAVLALEVNGDARAYPLQIMTWHELVNDTVGGVKVTISYCPLCNSSVAYDRNAAGRILDFGTSGSLYQSSMVMYDRQTQTLWTHFNGVGVIGELAGVELDFHPMSVVAWAAWRDAHPNGLVLTRDTGHSRAYGRNPYVGYESSEGLLTSRFQSVDIDGRLPAKERVVGIRTAGDAVAVRHEHLYDAGTVEVELDGVPLVVWNLPGASSALDGSGLSDGLDVGSGGVFERELDGRLLSFTRDGDGFRDAETGSTWNVFGEATAGDLAGSRLRPRESVDTFWFAWGTFEPESRIIPPPS